MHYRALAACALLAFAWSLPLHASDPPSVVWTFRDVAFEDGGSLSGHFTYVPALNTVTEWSVWSTGGDAAKFPLFEYRQDNSSLGQGSGGEIAFQVPVTFRTLVIRPSMPLTGSPLYVPLYLDFPSSSAFEGYDHPPSPIRLIQSGALFSDPSPTRVRWFFDDVTFDDGGKASGYVDQSPDDTSILKWAVTVSGGNEADFPSLTYNANTAGYTAILPFFSTQLAHEIDLDNSLRRFRYVGQAPLHKDGGRVAADTEYSVECFNCGPYRLFVSGTFRGVTDEVWGDGFD